MNRSLKPISGALLLGLVGTAYANCYYELSSVCKSPDELLGYGVYQGSCYDEIRAKITWYNWTVYDANSNGHTGLLAPDDCHGPAYYYNCVSMQRSDIAGDIHDTSISSQRVNYSSPACP